MAAKEVKFGEAARNAQLRGVNMLADAVKAVQLLRPIRVVPAHYNTWPPIEQDAGQWASLVVEETEAKPLVLEPGESFEL